MATPNLDALALIQTKIKHPTMGQNIPVGEENKYHSFVDFNTVKGAIQELKPNYWADEVDTGGTFEYEDGSKKPIYRKRFLFTIPANDSSILSFPWAIYEIDKIVKIEDILSQYKVIGPSQFSDQYTQFTGSSKVLYGNFGNVLGTPIKAKSIVNTLEINSNEIAISSVTSLIDELNEVLSVVGPEYDLKLTVTLYYTKTTDSPV